MPHMRDRRGCALGVQVHASFAEYLRAQPEVKSVGLERDELARFVFIATHAE